MGEEEGSGWVRSGGAYLSTEFFRKHGRDDDDDRHYRPTGNGQDSDKRKPLPSQDELYSNKPTDRGNRDKNDRYKDEPLPVLNSIHRAKCVSLVAFGAFCELEGYRRHGLVHVSQMSKSRVDNPQDVVSVGDRIFVKVVKISEDSKISLSMKNVGQSDGKDLDPNNVQQMLEDTKRRPAAAEKKRIEIGAILNTTCQKCGGKGHIAADCYSAGDTKYELLSEGEEDANANAARESAPTAVGDVKSIKDALQILHKHEKKHKDKDKDKKDKKEKRKHKHKKSDDEESHHKKHKSKHHHHHHHKDSP